CAIATINQTLAKLSIGTHAASPLERRFVVEDFLSEDLLKADDQPAQELTPLGFAQLGEVGRAYLFEISGGVGASLECGALLEGVENLIGHFVDTPCDAMAADIITKPCDRTSVTWREPEPHGATPAHHACSRFGGCEAKGGGQNLISSLMGSRFMA